MECFVIIINDWKPLTIVTKHSILDVVAALDPPLDRLLTILLHLRELSFCTGRGSRLHIFYKKDVLELLALFVWKYVCSRLFKNFLTPLGNRLCTFKNVRNILGTITKCYVFWRPITLLTVLLKINRTEGGSHVKILTILSRNHLQWSLFSSKVYNFSPTIFKKVLHC